ncbi:hypothetical protein ACFYSC_07155 [Streptosporangium sp. NPDC004379]|uniref:hypothetical protein n=1 Tax=Streptosporangium sp. NPDC004379 TaxID=3366189 RepID=UPI0036B59C40
MIRRLLVTSACVGLAVLAPAVAASASTAKTANCCGGSAFIPTSTVTYGQVVTSTPVAIASGANCFGGGVIGGGSCFGGGWGVGGSCWGGGWAGGGWGGAGWGGGLVPGGGGFLGGGNNINTLSPGTGVVGNGTGIGGLVGVGNLGIGIL